MPRRRFTNRLRNAWNGIRRDWLLVRLGSWILTVLGSMLLMHGFDTHPELRHRALEHKTGTVVFVVAIAVVIWLAVVNYRSQRHSGIANTVRALVGVVFGVFIVLFGGYLLKGLNGWFIATVLCTLFFLAVVGFFTLYIKRVSAPVPSYLPRDSYPDTAPTAPAASSYRDPADYDYTPARREDTRLTDAMGAPTASFPTVPRSTADVPPPPSTGITAPPPFTTATTTVPAADLPVHDDTVVTGSTSRMFQSPNH